jgi:vanillate O-demethylase ferredoxin subunit
MWRLAVGDTLPISAPQSFFSLDLTAPGYLLIAGGIGITPLVSMVQQLTLQLGQRQAAAHARGEALATPPVPVQMLYGARSVDELAYLDVLQAALGDALTVYVGGAPVDFERAISRLAPGGQVYTCGPVPMLEAVKAAWAVSARPVSDLRYETFGSSGKFAAQSFRLKVPRHGLDITVGTDSTLIEALEMAGIACLSDCRRGECGLCVTDVLSIDGQIDHRDVFLSEHEKRSNQRLCICVSRAVGTVTLDSAYRPDR